MADTNTSQVPPPAVMPQVDTPNTPAQPSAVKPALDTSGSESQAVPDPKAVPQHGSKTVMVVEDDAFLSNLLVTRLRGVGLNVIKASTGEEALNVLRTQEPPSLILLDIILPEKSGFEVLEEIQSDPNLQKAPVIIASNLGQETDVERGKQLGVIDYFVKAQTPIEDLVNKVKGIVEQGGVSKA